MRDQVIIEIDCEAGVISSRIDTAEVFSLAGCRLVRTGRAELIAQCLMPLLRELMQQPEQELKKRSLIAMGIKS